MPSSQILKYGNTSTVIVNFKNSTIKNAVKKGYKLNLSYTEVMDIAKQDSSVPKHFILYEIPNRTLVIGVLDFSSETLYGMRYNEDAEKLSPVVLKYLNSNLSKEHSFGQIDGKVTTGVIYHYEMIFGAKYDEDPKGEYDFEKSKYSSSGGRRRTRKTKKTKGSKRSKSTRGRR
jgi:hypothetical protein